MCRTLQLRQQGIGADEEEGTIDDPTFLMEMMEAREAVEEAGDTETLTRLQTEYRNKQQACMQVSPCLYPLPHACMALDLLPWYHAAHLMPAAAPVQDMSSAFSRGDYTIAYQAMIRLRYLRRILDAVEIKL